MKSIMDSSNDQYSIKNLLFSKAIPNYVIPIPTAGHRVYACTDCGDKFLLESSYDYHINRKSVKISYHCRLCNSPKTFYNRCNLLSHIRSHNFKTATINVSDLKLDPLPLNFYNKRQLTSNLLPKEVSRERLNCLECNMDIIGNETDPSFKRRVQHYMKVMPETYTCIFCLYTVPTPCALKSHMRFHLQAPPYICPECGMHLTQRSATYPYGHKCEGFMMMRATARLKCLAPQCHLVHPSQYAEHIKKNHFKTVYKCPSCYVACFDETIISNHLVRHHLENQKCSVFYQCDICPGKLVLPNQIESHCKTHMTVNAEYPCWACGKVFQEIKTLAVHHLSAHQMEEPIKTWLTKFLDTKKRSPKLTTQTTTKQKKVYRVVKRCDQCKRSFSYKCKFEQIKLLPNECPYKCTPSSGQTSSVNEQITCHICKKKMSQNWNDIKKHFNEFHKTQKCIDVKVIVDKLTDIEKYLPVRKMQTVRNRSKKGVVKRKRVKRSQNNEATANDETKITENPSLNKNNTLTCRKCRQEFEIKESLEKHLVIHRDPCMAYQCMECGQSFVVKPTFSKHLLLEHNICNVDDYITDKQCFNESALLKYQDNSMPTEPLRENQCKICRDQFENPSDLEKHFRVHGMAFLLQNNSNKAISP